jgi:Transposase DDE domain group 1
VNDAERLRHDPAMRWIVGEKAVSGRGASASQMGRFETRWLAAKRNLSALADLSGQWIDRVHGRRPPRAIVLDMDSSVSPTHGEQEMSVWNGHYACTCYHPLFLFNQFGDLERCSLRPGNVHSADGWEGVLKPIVMRYQSKVSRLYFRDDRCTLRDWDVLTHREIIPRRPDSLAGAAGFEPPYGKDSTSGRRRDKAR